MELKWLETEDSKLIRIDTIFILGANENKMQIRAILSLLDETTNVVLKTYNKDSLYVEYDEAGFPTKKINAFKAMISDCRGLIKCINERKYKSAIITQDFYHKEQNNETKMD